MARPIVRVNPCHSWSCCCWGYPRLRRICPNQQWPTVTTVTGTNALALEFGQSGNSAIYAITSGGGGFNSLRTATGLSDPNSDTFISPTMPADAGSIIAGVGTDGVVTTQLVFDTPVDQTMIHFINLDGSSLEVIGTSTTGAPIQIETVSKNSQLTISGNTVNPSLPAASGSLGCQANDGTNPGGRCGSFTLAATSGDIKQSRSGTEQWNLLRWVAPQFSPSQRFPTRSPRACQRRPKPSLETP